MFFARFLQSERYTSRSLISEDLFVLLLVSSGGACWREFIWTLLTYNSNYYVLMILVYFKYIFQGYLVLLCLLLSLNVYVYNIINKFNSIEIG